MRSSTSNVQWARAIPCQGSTNPSQELLSLNPEIERPSGDGGSQEFLGYGILSSSLTVTTIALKCSSGCACVRREFALFLPSSLPLRATIWWAFVMVILSPFGGIVSQIGLSIVLVWYDKLVRYCTYEGEKHGRFPLLWLLAIDFAQTDSLRLALYHRISCNFHSCLQDTLWLLDTGTVQHCGCSQEWFQAPI